MPQDFTQNRPKKIEPKKWVRPEEVDKAWEELMNSPCTPTVRNTNAYYIFHVNVSGCKPLR